MKIGAMVGKTDKGKMEYIGNPGDIAALRETMNEIRANGGKVKADKKTTTFVELFVADVASHPLYRKKCG